MSQRDIHSVVDPIALFGPVVMSADNTPLAVDIAGFQAAMVNIFAGIGGITFDGTNKIEFKLYHGADTVFANATAVAQADVRGVTVGSGGIVRSLTAAKAAADSKPTKIGYVGGKRYLFLLADFSGTHGTGTPLAAWVSRANPMIGPV